MEYHLRPCEDLRGLMDLTTVIMSARFMCMAPQFTGPPQHAVLLQLLECAQWKGSGQQERDV